MITPLFRCNDCGHEFEIPDTEREYRGEFWGVPAFENVAVCPMCRSDDFEEINESEDEEREENERDRNQ